VNATSAQAVPTAREILARHEAAIGGRAALDRHTSLRMAGTVQITSADLNGRIEILRAKPNSFVQKMSFDEVGEILKGFDGTTAWAVELTRPALLTDLDAHLMRLQADWYNEIAASPLLQAGQVDSAEFDGERAWRVMYASELGVETAAYFSRETGLRLGETSLTSVGMQTFRQSNYRDFGGIRIATRRSTQADVGEIVVEISQVEFDKVKPDAFEPPAAVKALIRKK
jgi:hypothetical protein